MTPFTNAQIIQQWSALAPESGAAFGDEGDFARQALLNPTLFELLGDVAGQTILDAGCGNGYLARLLSQRGAKVVGLEPATPLFQYAQKLTLEQAQFPPELERNLHIPSFIVIKVSKHREPC